MGRYSLINFSASSFFVLFLISQSLQAVVLWTPQAAEIMRRNKISFNSQMQNKAFGQEADQVRGVDRAGCIFVTKIAGEWNLVTPVSSKYPKNDKFPYPSLSVAASGVVEVPFKNRMPQAILMEAIREVLEESGGFINLSTFPLGAFPCILSRSPKSLTGGKALFVVVLDANLLLNLCQACLAANHDPNNNREQREVSTYVLAKVATTDFKRDLIQIFIQDEKNNSFPALPSAIQYFSPVKNARSPNGIVYQESNITLYNGLVMNGDQYYCDFMRRHSGDLKKILKSYDEAGF